MPSYSKLLKDISSGKVESIELFPTRREVKVKFNDGVSRKVPIFPNDQTILRLAQETGTKLTVNYLRNESSAATLFGNFGLIFLFVFVFLFLLRRSVDVANKTFGFFAKANKLKDSEQLTTRFDDVAGINEALEEIKEIVIFLKNY